MNALNLLLQIYIYVRRTIAGEFVVVNKYLLGELIDLDLWTDEIKNKIISHNGSIQNIEEIPSYIKKNIKLYGKFL